MTDNNADGEIKNSSGHEDASPAPETADTVSQDLSHDVKAQDEVPAESVPLSAAPQPSKEITLQRLTPHSSWEDYVRDETEREQAHAAAASTSSSGRRLMPIAAMVAVAAVIGAIAGSLATAGFGHFATNDQTSATVAALAAEQSRTVEAAIGKINAEIATLKANSASQSAKIVDRIDRVEKAQAEPAAKLAKLSDAVEKLRAPAPAPAASQEATGSIKSAPAAAAQPNRLPVVDGWALREVSDGIATVVGRQGIFDVIPGDPLPGIGRVDAIRRQDGRWVVVTSRGLIIAR